MEKPKMKLMVIEDNPEDVTLLSKRLENLKFDHEMIPFSRGEDGIRYVEAQSAQKNPIPDLILLDLGLPGEHGLEVLKKLKNHTVLKSTPIIVVTSSDEKIDKVETFRRGGTFFITKPYTEDLLREVISHLRVTGRIG
jgi:CheY-like chemotaxis protein